MNCAQLIYRGKLSLNFDIPFLDTLFYLHVSHLYTSTLFHVFSCGSACGSICGSAYGSICISGRGSSCGSSCGFARASTRSCLCRCFFASSYTSLCTSYGGLGREV